MVRKVKLRALLPNLSLLAAALVVAALVGEIVLRWMVPHTDSPGSTSLLTEYDSLLGWRPIPNASDIIKTDEYSVSVQINSRGIRGPEYQTQKPDGEYRIFLLGDSFAEGHTVNFEDLCSQVLKQQLNGLGDRPYEVINGGTAGYSTDQELLLFEHRGTEYEPDLTVLLFYVNDVWFNNQTRYWRGFKPRFARAADSLTLTNVPVPPPDPKRFAFEVEGGKGLVGVVRRADAWFGTHSALYGLLRAGITGSAVLNGLAIKIGFGAIPNEWRGWKIVPDRELQEAWRITEALLRDLRRRTAAAGSELVIFWIPARPAVYEDDWHLTRRRYAMTDDEWSPNQDGKVLAEICARNELDCVIPGAAFRQWAREHEGRKLYFAKDAHWTADGHRLAGELLAAHIANKYLHPVSPR